MQTYAGYLTRGAATPPAPRAPYGSHYSHNVMFLCNHNSCRSQMADAWLRTIAAQRDMEVGVASAGIVGGTKVKEGAILVMGEVGVDISGYVSEAMADFDHEAFDAVISCCGCGDKLNDEKAGMCWRWLNGVALIRWPLTHRNPMSRPQFGKHGLSSRTGTWTTPPRSTRVISRSTAECETR